MTNRVKLGLYKNDSREKDSHPHMKNGKPQEIPAGRYWVSAFINTNDPDTQALAEQLLVRLAKENNTYPCIGVSLSPANEQAPSQSGGGQGKSWGGDRDPF